MLQGELRAETRLENLLVSDERTGMTREARPGEAGAKKAALVSTPLLVRDGLTLADVRLETGRRHQIRVQHLLAGLPLWGDARYGGGRPGQQIALWAHSLTFEHPTLKTPVAIESLPPPRARGENSRSTRRKTHPNTQRSVLMFDLFLDSLLDGLKDGAWSLPVLFVAYLLMELLERSQKLNEEILHGYSHRAGPLLGGLLGVAPQCGISGAAATLFSTGSVTVGTMLAVFFATSDEMLPIMLSSVADGDIRLSSILLIVPWARRAAGRGAGLSGQDLLLTKYIRSQKNIHGFCEREHCACDEEEGSVFVSALKHTLKIAVMLIAVNVVLNFVLGMIGVERLSGSVLNRPFIGEILLALVGLIPNCSVSVVITESYLSGLIGLGGLFAGLLCNAGIGLLVLFRTNKNLKENLVITSTLYGLSAAAGIVITLVSGLL